MNGSLNLARRPYVNARPVVRTALLLWILGALLLLGNVFLFWSYLAGSSEKRAERARLEESVERQQKVVADLEARLSRLDLEQQNEQVAFLNSKIEERTFSWSLLFERLAEVLPNDVRLTQLQPAAIAADDRPGSRPAASTTRGRRPAGSAGSAGSSDRVPLFIQAESKSDEALSNFVDGLFAHPSFEDPDVSRETRDEDNDNRLRFNLQVTYIPAGARQPMPATPAIPAGSAGAKAETE